METEKKKSRFAKGDKITLVVLFVCTVLLAIINLLERAGYRMIRTEAPLSGALLLLLAMLGWGASALVRRFRRKTGKTIALVCCALILIILGSLAFTYVGQFAQLTLKGKYSTITSEDGKKAVVMMRVDTGLESEEAFAATNARMDARRDHIVSEDPTVEITDEDPYPLGAYGYEFTVYPVKAGVFFHEKADLEGAVYRGYSSEAKLLYEWQEDGSLRLYLENPEIGDEGEALLKY